jgi:hypothetical protein
MVDEWRVSVLKMILYTPAPDLNSVEWKRRMARTQFKYFDAEKKATIQAAIDADVKWLNAHQTKKTKAVRS